MQVTPHFSLQELTVSNAAQKLHLANNPPAGALANMQNLCNGILEKVRAHYGRPVSILSCYRSPEVNKAVGGSPESQHVTGEAADFIVKGVANKDVAEWIIENLDYDQVILEAYSDGQNWVHASLSASGHNRKEKFIVTKSAGEDAIKVPVTDFNTVPDSVSHVAEAAATAPAASPNPSAPPKQLTGLAATNALAALQQKCGIEVNGKWDATTFKAAMKYYGLSKTRAAHFFGQCNHETGNFRTFTENLNYSDKGLVGIFHKYFPTIASTAGYARNPQKIANKVYADRMGNGHEASGDGFKFCGRGAVQLTGRSNYQAFADYIKRPDIMTNPQIVATELAFESALFFFERNHLWAIADKGLDNATITAVTKRVNGGTIGLDDRIAKTKLFASWA